VPAITATISGPDRMEVNATRLFAYRVVNTGQVPLTNVRITATFDSRLELLEATEGKDISRLGQYQIGWTIPTMPVGPDPRSTVLLEAKFNALQINPRASMILTVESAESARATDSFNFEIIPGAPTAMVPPAAAPQLPPVLPPPTIPSTPSPIPADPNATPPSMAPLSGTPQNNAVATGNTLALSLLDRDDPVRVGQPIRYSLSVRNTSDQIDSEVGLRFKLPPGVELSRVVQRLAPQANQFRRDTDTIYLEDIRDLRSGEAVDYEIELISNQPQTIELTVEAVSRLVPDGTFATQTTRVIQ